MRNYDRWVERILFQLRRGLDSQRNENAEGRDQRLEQLARCIAEDTYFGGPDFPAGFALPTRLRKLEDQYEKLESQVASATSSILNELNKGFDRPAIACRMRDEDMSGGIAQLIVTGGSLNRPGKRGGPLG